MRAETRRRWAIARLRGPAYLWLTLTIFLPLSAMLWFSFQKKGPFGRHEAEFTLKHYEAFSPRPTCRTSPGVRWKWACRSP